MSTRALKLKLIVPRDDGPESVRLRRALFATHRFVNEAVAHYERLLLEMRQGDVCVGRDEQDRDVIEGAEVWRARLRERLARRGLQAGSIEAALPRFADLYRAIAKSSVEGGSGSGENGRNLHGALVADSSEAMAVVGEKLSIWRPVIDLGLRSAAAGAVFRLGEGEGAPPEEPLRWADPVAGLPVRHERSFLLRLPGEEPGERERAARERADDEVRAVRACLGHLQRCGRIYRAADPASRLEELARLGEELAAPRRTAPPVRATAMELDDLHAAASSEAHEWERRALAVYRRVEHDLGLHIEAWRAETRRRREPREGENRHALGGKSAWAVEHEERVRKTLIAWHRHQDPTRRELSRLDRRRQGTIARRLLDHITHLKDDRVKTTADLIVQAARGLVYHDGRWEKRHAPVDLIVLENLSRYRFRTDRAPAENRQLMQWSHREIDGAIRMQAELYGIAVADTGAAFSSRYDALTLAPGCRCRALTAKDLADLKDAESWIARRLDKLGVDRLGVRAGDIVPLDGGELFASPMGAADGLRVRHADLNAAQNIGLRYLGGHQHALRLRAARLGGAEDSRPARYVNRQLGERMQGAMGGKVALIEALGEVEHALRAFPSEAALAKALGVGRKELSSVAGPHDEEKSLDEEQLEQAAAQEELLEASSEWETFFRDPSGVIHHGRWVPAKFFWGTVGREVLRRLRAGGKLHG